MVTNYVDELMEIIKNGFRNFVDFVLELPGLLYDLVEVIPRPFYGVLLYFLSLFLFLLVTYAITRLFSIVKGG